MIFVSLRFDAVGHRLESKVKKFHGEGRYLENQPNFQSFKIQIVMFGLIISQIPRKSNTLSLNKFSLSKLPSTSWIIKV